MIRTAKTSDIPTHIKDKKLVERRRRQIVDAAVALFSQNGFHKTTTRQIARAANISIGLLYEYVATKEDILYLVCEAIHAEMHAAVNKALKNAQPGVHPLAIAIREFFMVCHRLSDHIVLIYQEIHCLPPKWRDIVLDNEKKITRFFTEILAAMVKRGVLYISDKRAMNLAAHNISVLGHMWAFRRWLLSAQFTIDAYIEMQTEFILSRYQPGDVPSADETGKDLGTMDAVGDIFIKTQK